MLIDADKRSLARVTAAVATTAAFAKMFLPFYLIGSTPIFASASVIGTALVTICWRPLCAMACKITDFLFVLTALYVFVIINFLLLSRPVVPITHLFGIIIFHALFLAFGFATARALDVLLLMLLGAAAIYLLSLIHI